MTSINYNEFQAGQGVSAPDLNENFTLTNSAISALELSVNASISSLTSSVGSKAGKNGDSSENFNVKDATESNHCVNLSQLKSYTPTGSVIWFAGSSAPSGFLLCDGSAVSRTDYADLFSVISTTYGAGDGSTSFNLPTLTDDRFIKGSATAGVSQNSNIASHAHAFSYSGATSQTNFIFNAEDTVLNYATADSKTNTTSPAGSGADTYPKNLSLLPCIKY